MSRHHRVAAQLPSQMGGMCNVYLTYTYDGAGLPVLDRVLLRGDLTDVTEGCLRQGYGPRLQAAISRRAPRQKN